MQVNKGAVVPEEFFTSALIKEMLEPEEFCKVGYVETNAPELLGLLAKEKEEIGLSGVPIYLFVPEEPGYILRRTGLFTSRVLCGDASVWHPQEDSYAVTIFPAGIQSTHGRRDTKHVIRHELAHIKNGDCDRKLPRGLRYLYRLLIEEPRAARYANMNE